LRVLQGIGYGFTIHEILNGKPQGANSAVWEEIRGGSTKGAFTRKASGHRAISSIRFILNLRVLVGARAQNVDYLIRISPNEGWILSESLTLDGTDIYSSVEVESSWDRPIIKVRYTPRRPGQRPHLSFQRSAPILHQLLRD